MKLNNEFLVNSFFEMNSKNSNNNKINTESFSKALNKEITNTASEKLTPSEVGNGDTFSEITSNANVSNGGGWTYVDKYGFSHVVSDYKTANEFKKPDTKIYSYNGKFGGGYALDEQNQRLRVPIPKEKPFENDLEEPIEKRAKMASEKLIGSEVSYLKYLEIISNVKNKVGI